MAFASLALRLSAVLQRVKSASVTIDNQLISSIGQGILVFAGVGREDTEKDVDIMAARVLKARLWPDETDAKTSVRYPAARKDLYLTFF
jgi:D-tyrosyl-tRNA(Tyr) deacylase